MSAYKKEDKKLYIENKIISLINSGYSKSDAEYLALDWWQEVSEDYDEEDEEDERS